MKPADFSVAMSVYKNDDPLQLSIALSSICEQSYVPSEIYLVIDGPIGNDLQSVIDSFSKKYNFFTINQLEKNGGLGNALKVAVENCKYDIIARMDSDDISAPGRFKKQIDAFLEEDVDVLGGWTLGFFGDLTTGDVSAFNSKLTNDEIYKQIAIRTPISHVTAMFKRSSVLSAGNYEDLFYHEDYYLWARMIKLGYTFKNIPEYLVYVRCGENASARHGGWRYFKAEKFLRKYMLKNGICSYKEYFKQMTFRIVYELILPPKIRVYIDKKFKRKYLTRNEANSIIQKNIDEDKKEKESR